MCGAVRASGGVHHEIANRWCLARRDGYLFIFQSRPANIITVFNLTGTFTDSSTISGTVTIDVTFGIVDSANLLYMGNTYSTIQSQIQFTGITPSGFISSQGRLRCGHWNQYLSVSEHSLGHSGDSAAYFSHRICGWSCLFS